MIPSELLVGSELVTEGLDLSVGLLILRRGATSGLVLGSLEFLGLLLTFGDSTSFTSSIDCWAIPTTLKPLLVRFLRTVCL